MKRVLRPVSIFCTLLAIVIFNLIPTSAEASALSIVGDNTYAGTTNVAIPLGSIQLSGASASTTPVKLLVSGGTIAMPVTTGLTFDGATTTTTWYFTGTVANINAALASLTYTKGSTGTDTLEISLVNKGEVFFADNGHLYKFVSDSGSWNASKPKAEALSAYGAQGYLATITSSAENAFVTARLGGAGWMGASDSESEGIWKWVTGPETGTIFWRGVGNGTAEDGRYANWNNNEPNQSGDEDCGQYLAGGTGKWNDLPCDTSILAGYVAEFGAPGALPTVTAKNVSITVSDAPTASYLTPADNATNASTTANLTIQFSKTVSRNNGSIQIRKVSDNSLVESIDVVSAAISGNNTNTITINPDTTLQESTAYYIIVPNTAFIDANTNAFAGITASTTWNFTTGDFTAPVISSVAASGLSSTTANIAWNTNENASSKMMLGLSQAYGSTTNEINTSPRVQSHAVSLSGLLACSTYYYRVISADASSNIATSTNNSFKTTGCPANAEAVAATSTPITSNTGGSTSLTEDDAKITVTAPSNFTSTSSTVVIQIQAMPGESVLGSIGTPSGVNKVGDIVFDVKAIVNSNTILDSFDHPVTITYQYTDADIAGLNESTLRLYHYHGNAWIGLNDCSIDMAANVISCTTPNFSIFSLFGQKLAVQTTSQSSGYTYGCQDPKASNYSKLVKHNQAMCMYAKPTPSVAASVSTPTATPTATGVFARNLSIGMSGADVKALQKFLNSVGFPIASTGPGSVGNETTMFGNLTKKALAKFQASSGISPAVGYFGPVTRAYIQSKFILDGETATVSGI